MAAAASCVCAGVRLTHHLADGDERKAFILSLTEENAQVRRVVARKERG